MVVFTALTVLTLSTAFSFKEFDLNLGAGGEQNLVVKPLPPSFRAGAQKEGVLIILDKFPSPSAHKFIKLWHISLFLFLA